MNTSSGVPASVGLDDLVVGILRDLVPDADSRLGGLGTLERRSALAAVLTARAPGSIRPTTLGLIERLLDCELDQKALVAAGSLPRIAASGVGAFLSLWQGDITTLVVDAIVNAANNQMLGCFIPGHACVDNAIHAAAGPRLRGECAKHMASAGVPEPTGAAQLTSGYRLPARYVLHTVGPIVASRQPTSQDAALLGSSYTACLEAAAEHGGISSVGFCSISTGVFGYPIEEAAMVAVEAVTQWLQERPEPAMHVVFTTFRDRDAAVYSSILARRFR